MPKSNNRNRSKQHQDVSIVGPDCIQVLQGSLFANPNQQQQQQVVSLILCGESHQDAMDVTRRGGRFDGKEGWIDRSSRQDILLLLEDECLAHVFASSKKLLPLQKAKDWAQQVVVEDSDDAMSFATLVLLWWVPEGQQGGRLTKGRACLVGFRNQEDDEEEEEDVNYWRNPNDMSTSLPPPVQGWVLGTTTSSTMLKSFEWGDLDSQAFALNQRRLTDEEISTEELDGIIRQRKEKLKQMDDIWTWDDWLGHMIQKQTQSKENVIDLHLILEASVAPWELSLHRPAVHEDVHLGPAADCIRSVEEDEEGDEEDDFDPSSDGIGSYLDFIYRRFMEAQFDDIQDKDATTSCLLNRWWLHCVDMRDLGCQAACHSDSVQSRWKDLLSEEEHKLLSSRTEQDQQPTFLQLEPDSKGKYIKFVPENRMNPERLRLESLRSEGRLVDGDESDSDSTTGDEDEFTYPSFEGFFGQNTDFLYYSNHVKLSYSPFLAKCVQSLDKWDQFFTSLFLGGTIPDALSVLQLHRNKEYLYVRSPIHKLDNHHYRHRDDGEHYITYPFFPFLFYLCANERSPPRTWSSNLFAKLCEEGEDADSSKHIAMAARDWTLQKIRHSCLDPKGADDPDCGGEWFEAYLHAVHRDIYDDIDRSDTTVLLKKNKMKSLTSNRKHNIGKIQIPSCKEGFEEILQAFKSSPNEQITPRTEVFAKILIDIYMSCLVDFSTVLKIAEIAKGSSEDKVVIVLYMGTAHTKAVSDFFVQRMGFRKNAFVGKVDWEENECHKLQLPKSLWNFSELFPSK